MYSIMRHVKMSYFRWGKLFFVSFQSFWPITLEVDGRVQLHSSGFLADFFDSMRRAMKNEGRKSVWCWAQMPEISRAVSIFTEAVCCLITHCWSHLPQTSGFKMLGPRVQHTGVCDLDSDGRGKQHRCRWFLGVCLGINIQVCKHVLVVSMLYGRNLLYRVTYSFWQPYSSMCKTNHWKNNQKSIWCPLLTSMTWYTDNYYNFYYY